MNIAIEKISNQEWRKYKNIRLEALQNEPTAFASSYEDSMKSEDDVWKSQLQRANEDNESTMFFAKDGEKIIGMIGVFWSNKKKVQHIASIFGVYVSTDYRGKGIGKMLMKKILKYLENAEQIKKVKLSVVTENNSALKLYEQFGFKKIGKAEKELKVDERFYDEYLLEKFI